MARNYLRDREIGQRTIESFDIGYAPQSREGLRLAMQQLGYSEGQLIDVGLLIKVDGKPSYDRFRGRVMFPIRRVDGRIIAFGGRLLERYYSKNMMCCLICIRYGRSPKMHLIFW